MKVIKSLEYVSSYAKPFFGTVHDMFADARPLVMIRNKYVLVLDEDHQRFQTLSFIIITAGRYTKMSFSYQSLGVKHKEISGQVLLDTRRIAIQMNAKMYGVYDLKSICYEATSGLNKGIAIDLVLKIDRK
jgi:hypothetical protein